MDKFSGNELFSILELVQATGGAVSEANIDYWELQGQSNDFADVIEEHSEYLLNEQYYFSILNTKFRVLSLKIYFLLPLYAHSVEGSKIELGQPSVVWTTARELGTKIPTYKYREAVQQAVPTWYKSATFLERHCRGP